MKHSDKELLELAAKAAGYVLTNGSSGYRTFLCLGGVEWNPLTDDGDAMRLAVKLSLDVNIYNLVVYYHSDELEIEEHFPQGVIHDVTEATRRAIVNVAAEIGRTYE